MAKANSTRLRSDIHVFGVRHLSPMGAWHLRRFLDQIRPTAVLIEGLADAEGLIPDIVRSDTQPPIAILAYTEAPPVRTLVYPLARYSPEYQAMRWADQHDVPVSLIDLPSDVFLALHQETESANPSVVPEGEPESEAQVETQEQTEEADPTAEAEPSQRRRLYDFIASFHGEADYESYWERHYEHHLSEDAYRRAAFELGTGLREFDRDHPRAVAENLVREAFMRRRIDEVLRAGHAPQRIVAIVGAYHSMALGDDLPAMSDEEFKTLRRAPSKLTLMPYSYFKLSSQSGYGAGNHAPAYFELIWDALTEERPRDIPARYLAAVVRQMRGMGTHRSTAEVIEGVRLARELAGLRESAIPVLRDLQDAAVTTIGQGERAAVQDAMARIEVGTAIGNLPQGVSRTSIQDDFQRSVEQLRLTKYRTTVKQDLVLDLRENRQAKTEAAAFLDLQRSTFFHRLMLLGVAFAVPGKSRQDAATWAEHWHLQWTPEVEIALVESVLLGETVDLAARFKFKSLLEQCDTIEAAAEAVAMACRCSMFDSMEVARQRLQEIAVSSSDFVAIADAAHRLAMVIRYGDVRQFDPAPLLPLLEQLFVQGTLALFAMANCDLDAARKLADGMDQLNRIAQEHHARIDESLWIDQLRRLSDADDRNPLVSGFACSILLERSLMANDQLSREVSRRLSPGVPADLGAGWFEGISRRNRYALLARQTLWQHLADYVSELDDEEFKRALVFLRRAFGNFSPSEKRSIGENLGEIWGVAGDAISELIEQPLSDSENEALNELNDFNFDDL